MPRSRRRSLLLHARALWTPATVARLYDEALRLMHVDLPQADRIARAAVWLAREMRDAPARAASLRALGHIFCTRRQYASALDHYRQALDIYRQAGLDLELGRTLNGALQSLVYLGRYEEAHTFAQQAREIFTHHHDRLRLARLDTNLGNLMFRQDRFEEALELYRSAHSAFLEIGEPSDIAIALKNTATCQISLNDFRQALETYQNAREYCVAHQLPLLVAVADYNIAYLYYLRGEYTRAIELYRAAREHCHSLGDTYREGLCDLDRSEMYLELNLNEEGAYLARQALDAFQHLGVGYESAKALTNLAISLSHHGDYRLALDLFSRARELFTQENNRAWIASIDLYQAMISHQEHRLAEAHLLCERALEYFQPSPFATKTTLCELLLARIHLDAGRAAEARRLCLNALQRLARSESPTLFYQAYFVLGLVEEALDDPDAAYGAYLKAHEQLENLRSRLNAEEMKVAFLKDKLEVYEALVRMCLGRRSSPQDLETAFVYIEQAKSRSLADLLAFRVHHLPPSTETHRALAEQVGVLRQELNWYNRALHRQENCTPAEPQLEKLRRAARECEQRLLAEMANLHSRDKEFANLHAAGSIEIEAIRSVLPSDAVLLQYFRVRNTFYACLLSARDLKIMPLGPVSTLRRALQLLRFQLSKFRLGPEYTATFHRRLLEATDSHLQAFHRELIAPIQQHLDCEHLIVAPHGFLHYLPFHALRHNGEYLGARHSVSYTPSASVYYLCSTRDTRPSGGSLVMGIPDPAAPHILDEVRAVSSVLPQPESYVGCEATAGVLRDRGPRSRFVHIATHGRFRQDNPMFSSIGLGDSELSLFDLYQLNLPAELVTLSGCGTGLNVVVGGDELMGLTRGLLYAGAQAVLLTLWDVNDRSTADFMKLFYQCLNHAGNRADKSRALRYAMEEIRREYPHPFYWAPFILLGKYS